MAYKADPGGVFGTNVHRRTLGHLTATAAARRPAHTYGAGEDSDLDDEDELVGVLEDLEADGYASRSADGWKQTKKGLDAFSAPVPESG